MAVSYQGNHDISYLLSLPRLGAFTSITAWEVAGKWNLCQVWLNVQRQNCPKPKGIKHWFCPLVPFFSERKGVSGAAGSVRGHWVQFLVQFAVRSWVPSPVPAKWGQLWGKGWNVCSTSGSSWNGICTLKDACLNEYSAFGSIWESWICNLLVCITCCLSFIVII